MGKLGAHGTAQIGSQQRQFAVTRVSESSLRQHGVAHQPHRVLGLAEAASGVDHELPRFRPPPFPGQGLGGAPPEEILGVAEFNRSSGVVGVADGGLSRRSIRRFHGDGEQRQLRFGRRQQCNIRAPDADLAGAPARRGPRASGAEREEVAAAPSEGSLGHSPQVPASFLFPRAPDDTDKWARDTLERQRGASSAKPVWNRVGDVTCSVS